MLFIPQQPIKVKVTEDKKIIILTKNKIMFTNLDFIQEFLSMPVIGGQPLTFYYASQTMQVLVQSLNTLQIYYCDWKTQIKLRKVIILNNQPIYSVYFDENTGWNIIGNLLQYQQPKVTYHQANKHFSGVIQKCYIEKSQYILTQNKLYKCLPGQNPLQVTWRDFKTVLNNCLHNLSMIGTKSSNKQKDIICINQRYIIAIQNFNVILTIERQKVLYIQNSLFISQAKNGGYYNFNHLQHRQAVDIGSVNKFQQVICAGRVYDDLIISLCFSSKQLKIINLPLIEDKESDISGKKTIGLHNPISKIVERSNEQGSLFQHIQIKKPISNKYNQAQQNQQNKQKPIPANIQVQAQQSRKSVTPIIRDIQVQGQQVIQKSINSDNSQILDRIGIENKKKNQSFSIGDINKKTDSNLQQSQIQIQIESSSASQRRMSQGFKSNLVEEDVKHRFKVKKRFTDQGSQSGSRKKDSSKQKNSQKISVFNQSSVQDNFAAETPAFGNQGFGGGFGNQKWQHYQKQWQFQTVMDKVEENQYQQSYILDENERSMLGRTFTIEESKKIQAFKPEGVKLTIDLARQIEQTSYIKLMNQVYKKDIDKFTELLNQFLWQIVEDKNCPLFFAEHIRAFSPKSTQDKIKRIFQPYQKKKKAQQKITQALKQFKINQVPLEYLKFNKQFIKILNILYPEIYIGDILEPSKSTIQFILESYFNIEVFPQQNLLIENQQINISHPRNLLNILLYLNQTFDLNIVDIIKIYCEKIIQHNHLDIIKQLQQENIFEICQVPPSILIKVIIDRFNDLLIQSVEHADYLWDLVQFLNGDILQQYEMKLATVQQLNRANIFYQVNSIIDIKNPQTDIFVFLQTIINLNSALNLKKLKLGNIYRSLFWLQQSQKLVYYTIQYIQLVKQYAQKLIKQNYLHQAFVILDSVISKIKKSFLAKLLYQYLDSKLLDKIAQVSLANISYVFLQILTNQNIKQCDILHEQIQNPQYSNHFTCSWDHFLSVFRRYFQQPAQLQYFVYVDFLSAYELFAVLDQYKKNSFQKFINDIRQSIIGQIQNHKMIDDDSHNPKGITNIVFLSKNQILASERGTSSMLRNQQYLLYQPAIRQRKNTHMFKSMTLIDHLMKVRQSSRANSQRKCLSGSVDDFQQLYRLKILVHPDQILESLKQIYQTSTRKTFIKALTLIDMQKITLYHLDSYRLLASKGILFKFQIIIPFIVFRIKDKKQCFKKIKNKIQVQLNLQNFWLIWNIINLFFGQGLQVSKMLLKKIIYYYQNDQLGDALKFLLTQIKSLNNSQKQQYLNFTQENKLYRLNTYLKNL